MLAKGESLLLAIAKGSYDFDFFNFLHLKLQLLRPLPTHFTHLFSELQPV